MPRRINESDSSTNNYDKTPFGPFTPYLHQVPEVEEIMTRYMDRPSHYLTPYSNMLNRISSERPNEQDMTRLQPFNNMIKFTQSSEGTKEIKEARRNLKAALNINCKLDIGIRDVVEDIMRRDDRAKNIRKISNTIAHVYSRVALSSNLSVAATSAIFLEGLKLNEYVIQFLHI